MRSLIPLLNLPVLIIIPGPGVDVPRSTTLISIDGQLTTAEWERASVQRFSDGSTMRLQHDGRFLYLGIEPTRPGFPSVCVVHRDGVRVLHASAALGAVMYRERGGSWSSIDTAFTYSMRSVDTAAAGRAERQAYLEGHGWVASTFNMTQGRGVEMQVALDQFAGTPRIFVSYFVAPQEQRAIIPWPASITDHEGCMAGALVRGEVPRELTFKSAEWAELRLR